MDNKGLLLFSDQNLWKNINNLHANKGGVYKIIAVENKLRVPINRFLDIDKNGVLYIGKANSFVDRVIDLKKSISHEYKGTAHICGRRYKSIKAIAEKFPYTILHVELIQDDNPLELERKLLKDYINIYGEVPPLNAI